MIPAPLEPAHPTTAGGSLLTLVDRNRIDLTGQVAVITGGAGAIGGATAEALADVGATVILVDIDKDAVHRRLRALRANGALADGLVLDVKSDAELTQAIRHLDETQGRLDILINAAGVLDAIEFTLLTPAKWRQVFAVNVEAPLVFTRACAPIMAQQTADARTGTRGRIVNLSSGASRARRSVLAAYGASKAALEHLTASTAVAYQGDLIATTAVYPGQVLDGMLTPALEALAQIEGRDPADLIAERRRGSGVLSSADSAEIIVRVVATPGMGLNGHAVNHEMGISKL